MSWEGEGGGQLRVVMQPEEVASVNASSVVEEVGEGTASPRGVDPFEGGAVLEAAVVVDCSGWKPGQRCSLFVWGILPHRGMMTSPGYPFPSVVVTSGQKELSYTTVSTVLAGALCLNPLTPKTNIPDSSTPASYYPPPQTVSHYPSTP